jgi:RNA polymerase sigma factor (sigma-70 family)
VKSGRDTLCRDRAVRLSAVEHGDPMHLATVRWPDPDPAYAEPHRARDRVRRVGVSDEVLLAGFAAGDPNAAAALVGRYQARVFGLAYTIVGSRTAAEDVAQEAFVRVWRNASAYDPRRGRVGTWILTITRNAAIDALRLRTERPVDPQELGSCGDGDSGSVSLDSTYEEKELLGGALRALPPEQSKPIVMSVFHALTAKEIADRENIPVGTVKTRIRRGLIRLRQIIAALDE